MINNCSMVRVNATNILMRVEKLLELWRDARDEVERWALDVEVERTAKGSWYKKGKVITREQAKEQYDARQVEWRASVARSKIAKLQKIKKLCEFGGLNPGEKDVYLVHADIEVLTDEPDNYLSMFVFDAVGVIIDGVRYTTDDLKTKKGLWRRR